MKHKYSSHGFKAAIFVVLIVLCGISLRANNYLVTVTSNSGSGSLRAAIDSANLSAGLDTVVMQLSVQDTIYLASALPAITDSLLITGLACQNPTISGNLLPFASAAFVVSSNTMPLTLSYLNIMNCVDTSAGAPGGAVNAHTLFVNYCYFANNKAYSNTGNSRGGAIDANTLTITNSTFSGNSASNHAGSSGAGGAIYSSTLATMYNCTFSFNSAASTGGAVASQKAVVGNCTIVNNNAGVRGGGFQSGSDSVSITNSIIWGNAATDSAAGVYFSALVNSGGCNVLQASASNINFISGSSDIAGSDPMLDTLGYFNGCVPVIPIFCGSVAQDHANCAGATTTDAEGIPANGIRDAGAFEITTPNVGNDTIDSIQRGATVDLLTLFNTQGLAVRFYGHYTDSTQVDTGTYTVIAYNYLGCSDTASAVVVYLADTAVVDTITGFQHLSATDFAINISPNPANNVLNVRLSSNTNGPVDLRIIDALGRAVMAQRVALAGSYFSTDITGVATGLYYLVIKDGNGLLSSTKFSVVLK